MLKVLLLKGTSAYALLTVQDYRKKRAPVVSVHEFTGDTTATFCDNLDQWFLVSNGYSVLHGDVLEEVGHRFLVVDSPHGFG